MQYKVYVRCYTYNQASYIVDALNGFTMQQTDFPYVCIIVDDASIDGESYVIKQYLADHFDLDNNCVRRTEETEDYYLIFARHKTNLNCYFAVLLLKYNHYHKKPKAPYFKEWTENVKYVALCEGDDYWTDSRKLQMQVDFLDTHPDYSLCCHRFKIYHEDTDSWSDDYVGEAFSKAQNAEGLDIDNEANFRTRFSWTLTLCYRKSSLDGIQFPPYKLGRRDFHLHYHLLKVGKGYCFADSMGVYRMNRGGVWTSLSSLDKAMVRLFSYQDSYRFNKDDVVVHKMYCEWLGKFFFRFVLPPFSRHELTRDGIKSLICAFGHYWRTQGAKKAFSILYSCIRAFFLNNNQDS